MKPRQIKGIFIREEKNRFLCTVKVNNVPYLCYIPSSCRLDNFINLSGEKVLLRENKNKSTRTKFAVYAICFRNNYIVLKTAEANNIVLNAIQTRRFSFLGDRKNIIKECTICGYKSDIYLPDTKTIIEIKSIISVNSKAEFPSVFSERAIKQLKQIKKILKLGYKFVYVFVSLNPYVNQIEISNREDLLEYKKLFMQCIRLGMEYYAYSSIVEDGIPQIYKKIKIII